MFCGPETVDVSRGEAEGNIDSRGSTKHTAFPRSQSISVLLYTECQKRRKVPQINQTCVKRITFYLTWLRVVKSLNQTICTGVYKLEHPPYN